MQVAWIPIFLIIPTLISPASAHSVTWPVNGKTYNYDVLLKGQDCCGGSECRPAFGYKPSPVGWKFVIPKSGLDPESEKKRIEVAEAQVTYRDLDEDGVAHACGYFDGTTGEWKPYCTFVPPQRNAYLLFWRIVGMWDEIVSNIFGSAQAHAPQ